MANLHRKMDGSGRVPGKGKNEMLELAKIPKELNGYRIIAKQELGTNCEAVILAYNEAKKYEPYVTAFVSNFSLDHSEWYWGHYFNELSEAVADFEARALRQ